MADVYKRQIRELEDSLRVRCVACLPVVGLLRRSWCVYPEDKSKELDERRYELEQLREEKHQEIQILRESVDSTSQQMAEMQAVCLGIRHWLAYQTDANIGLDPRHH